MFQGTFREQVDRAATGAEDPGEGDAAVDETEDFHAIQTAEFICPGGDFTGAFHLSLRDAGGCDFQAVDVQFLDQQTGNTQLFLRGKGGARCLFSIAQGGVHDLDDAFALGHIG